MTVPRWAGFVASVPDDQIESSERIEVFGGRNLALLLSGIFEGLGATNLSEPWVSDVEGWEFDFSYRGHRFWCQLQSFHPIFWLLLDDRSSGAAREGQPSVHLELWQTFSRALEQDPRFDQILWRPFGEGPPDWDEFKSRRVIPSRRMLMLNRTLALIT